MLHTVLDCTFKCNYSKELIHIRCIYSKISANQLLLYYYAYQAKTNEKILSFY